MYIIITNLGITNKIDLTEKTTKTGNLEDRVIGVEGGKSIYIQKVLPHFRLH